MKNWILWAGYWHLSIYEIFNMEPGVYKISVTSYWHNNNNNYYYYILAVIHR